MWLRSRVQRVLVNTGTYAVACGFRLLPLRLRFPSAVRFASRLTNLRPRRRSPEPWLDPRGTFNLMYVLGRMDDVGCRYVPHFSVDGADHVATAFGLARGVLFVSAHFKLGFLFSRWLFDLGHPVAVIAATQSSALPHVSGSADLLTTFVRSP